LDRFEIDVENVATQTECLDRKMIKPSDVRKVVSCTLGSLGIFTCLAGCGGSMQPPPIEANATTKVVALLTTTANDKLAQFNVAITSIALTDTAGNSVTLFDNTGAQGGLPHFTEFMKLNGASEPLVTATVPQGTYNAANIKIGACEIGNVTIVSGGLVVSGYEQGTCSQGTGNATVNFASPITISGSATALSFNLQVSPSYEITNSTTYTISPVFNVTPISIAANPTNESNGKIIGVDARIVSVNPSGSFVIQTADGVSSTLSASSDTEYQGVTGFDGLAQDMIVNLDSAIQADGTLLATRVEVQDPTVLASDIALPIATTAQAGTVIVQPLECFPEPGAAPICDSAFQSDTTTQFHVSGQFSNLQDLPFAVLFDSTSQVLGQNVSIASRAAQSVPIFATHMTLEPQTLNGVVTAVSNVAGFSVFTVALAPYDLIPTTQQQAVFAPFATIVNPTTVTVYVDNNARLLQSGAVGPGSSLRVRGLVFNDNGTLRMDCAEVLDGVAE
jgi:hypothetical protein